MALGAVKKYFFPTLYLSTPLTEECTVSHTEDHTILFVSYTGVFLDELRGIGLCVQRIWLPVGGLGSCTKEAR